MLEVSHLRHHDLLSIVEDNAQMTTQRFVNLGLIFA